MGRSTKQQSQNPTFRKKVDDMHKVYGRWRKEMQVEGFTKREELSADTAQRETMSPLCQALWDDFKIAARIVDEELANPSQLTIEED